MNKIEKELLQLGWKERNYDKAVLEYFIIINNGNELIYCQEELSISNVLGQTTLIIEPKLIDIMILYKIL